MSEIKNLLAKMINKINSNEDRIENIEENGVGGGVSSWNDLTDKPFGEVEGEVEKVYVQYASNFGYDANSTFTCITNGKDAIVKGNAYTIVFNDVEYPNCVATGDEIITVECSTDNGFVRVEYSGEQTFEEITFTHCYTMYVKDTTIGIPAPDTLTASVKVFRMEQGAAIKRLDGKYLPEGLPYAEKSDDIVEIHSGTFTEDGGEEQMYVTSPIGLVAGNEYIVMWNGTEHRCAAIETNSEGLSGVAIGNLAQLGHEDNGLPFIFMEFYEPIEGIIYGAQMPFMDESTVLPIVFSISANNETVHKLDNKYLDLAWLPTTSNKKLLFLPETTVPMDEISGYDAGYQIENGDYYSVVFDGQEYTGKVLFLGGYSGIGNGAIVSPGYMPDTGEPFFVYIDERENVYDVQVATSDNNTHTIEVYIIKTSYNRIPDKFLPEAFPTITTYYVHNLGGTAENQLYADEGMTTEVFPDELFNAYRNGILHIINMETGNMHVPIGEYGRHVIVITELRGGNFDDITFRPCSAVLL